jgi:hypothetical protein
MWIIRDQTILINKTCTVPGILVEIFLFFSSSEFADMSFLFHEQ